MVYVLNYLKYETENQVDSLSCSNVMLVWDFHNPKYTVYPRITQPSFLKILSILFMKKRHVFISIIDDTCYKCLGLDV